MRRGALRALVVGAAIAEAVGGARAEVHPIDANQCFRDCNLNPTGDPTSVRQTAEMEVMMSLCGGERTDGDGRPERPTLVLDLKNVPAELAAGPQSPFTRDENLTPTVRSLSSYFDVDVVMNGPHPIGAAATVGAGSFFSAPSLGGGLTLSGILEFAHGLLATTWSPRGPDI